MDLSQKKGGFAMIHSPDCIIPTILSSKFQQNQIAYDTITVQKLYDYQM